jgi:lactoylglutathione lyase
MNFQGVVWVGLFVENLEASVSYYKDIVGLPLLNKGDGWAHFDAGNGSLFEVFSGGKATQEPKKPDRQSIVFGFQVENLDSAVAELKARGVVFSGDVKTHKTTRWAYFSDPEGNRLEIKEILPE